MDYLRGYVDGYWEGYDYARSGLENGVGEGEGAAGDVDASSDRIAPAGAPAHRPSSLPTISQAAGDGRLRHDIQTLYVHRGMIMALRTMRESFADMHMDDAVAFCEQVALTLRSSSFRKLS